MQKTVLNISLGKVAEDVFVAWIDWRQTEARLNEQSIDNIDAYQNNTMSTLSQPDHPLT